MYKNKFPKDTTILLGWSALFQPSILWNINQEASCAFWVCSHPCTYAVHFPLDSTYITQAKSYIYFFKIIKNIDYSILDSFDVNNIYNNKLSNEIISSIRERIIRVNNNKVKIATLTLKRSPIKGITLYSTKRELYSYYLNLYN